MPTLLQSLNDARQAAVDARQAKYFADERRKDFIKAITESSTEDLMPLVEDNLTTIALTLLKV